MTFKCSNTKKKKILHYFLKIFPGNNNINECFFEHEFICKIENKYFERENVLFYVVVVALTYLQRN